MPCPQDDILLYAKDLYGRHGPHALHLADRNVDQYSALGDAEATEVWRGIQKAVTQFLASEQPA
jgi:hypothetical protein